MTETMHEPRSARRSSSTGGRTARRWCGTWSSRTGWTQAVFEAQETTGDLLYELVSVKKMNYPAAWELATQEWALPQSGNQEETTSGDLPPSGEPVRDLDPENSTSATSHRTGARRLRRATSG